MEKVGLYVGELCLGSLVFAEGKFVYSRNLDNEKAAYEKFPVDMMLYPFKGEEVEKFDRLPYPFSNYIGAMAREDLKAKADILESDTLFEKLYKLSKLNFVRENFVIKAV